MPRMPTADPPQDPSSEGPLAPDAGEGSLRSARLQGNITQRVETYLNRAQAQIQLQRWMDALVSLEAALALAPDHAKAQELRTQVMVRLGRRLD